MGITACVWSVHKGKLRDLLAWYRKQMRDPDIEVDLNYEVRTILEFGRDPVIIATGAAPRKLKQVKGFEKAIEACEFLSGRETGETVAVIGGRTDRMRDRL